MKRLSLVLLSLALSLQFFASRSVTLNTVEEPKKIAESNEIQSKKNKESNESSQASNNLPKDSFVVQVSASQHAKTKLLLGAIGDTTREFSLILDIIKKDLEFSGQFVVDVRHFTAVQTKHEISLLAEQNYALVLFLNMQQEDDSIEWRVYDAKRIEMLKGSKYAKRGSIIRGWAHNISDSLWQVLTGCPGFFSTKIAYCKDIRVPRKKAIKYIYIADYDGSNEQQLVALPTVNVAPRWNNDAQKPLLFYSEYTNSNVRLIVINMDKKRKIASNFDGVNMLPSFSGDGKKVTYCASKGKGNCQIYYYEKGIHKKITNNKGNNVSPTFSNDGKKVFFCSDFQTGLPQIYCYDMEKDSLIRLTKSGYCASPSYCPISNKVAYSKIVSGIMQIFVYDIKEDKHIQITFDQGHKEECSWSPCGNFLLFSYEDKAKSRIAMMSLITKERMYLTDAKNVCTYPSWSPIYQEFPVVA